MSTQSGRTKEAPEATSGGARVCGCAARLPASAPARRADHVRHRPSNLVGATAAGVYRDSSHVVFTNRGCRLMKHEDLYPEKVQCECGVQVSAADKRALLRHQGTKGHLAWASKECASRPPPALACFGELTRSLRACMHHDDTSAHDCAIACARGYSLARLPGSCTHGARSQIEARQRRRATAASGQARRFLR
jgi:hypothetical protein